MQPRERGARYVAVESHAELAGEDPIAARRAARLAVERRLHDAAVHALAPQGPLLAGVLAAQLLLGLLAAGPETSSLFLAAWVLSTAACAGGMATWARWGRTAATTALHGALAALAAACVAVPALWATGDGLATVGAVACLFAGLASTGLAPAPWVAAPLAGLIAIPALVLALWVGSEQGSWPWAIAALAATAACVQAALLRRRSWTRMMQALIEQGDRMRQLERERDTVLQADQEKSRFLAIASHDLRQPVHALALFTSTLHKRMRDAPDEPLVRNMVRALDGLERSFNAMLDVSRLDSGSMRPTMQTFYLRDLFRRLHMHYGGQAELAGLALRLSPGGKSVSSDPQMLERILGNLIQNAIKYTEQGGIAVVARSTAAYVNVEVWDTGSGIASNELRRIFDEFYQVGRGERDRAHGLGMGLAIVKRLAQALGHRLEVASRPGKGTMFRVGIPIGGLPGIQETLAPADTVPMTATEPRMVLVIDDEEPIREGLRLLLEEWGFQSVAAADSAQAEQCVRALEGRVDLILSDLHLGSGPDGLEAIDNVRRLCLNEVPAILVTGDTSSDEMRRIAASGHPVLFKPLQPRRLFDALRDLLA